MQSFFCGKAADQFTDRCTKGSHRHAALGVTQVVVELLLAFLAKQAVRHIEQTGAVRVHFHDGLHQLNVVHGFIVQLDLKTGFRFCNHAFTSLLSAVLSAADWVAAVPPRMYS